MLEIKRREDNGEYTDLLVYEDRKFRPAEGVEDTEYEVDGFLDSMEGLPEDEVLDRVDGPYIIAERPPDQGQNQEQDQEDS